VAVFPLAAAAAGARIVAAAACIFDRVKLHDLGWRAPAAQLLRHEAHCGVDVVEEVLVAGAEVVEPGSPLGVEMKRSFGQPPWQAKRTSPPEQGHRPDRTKARAATAVYMAADDLEMAGELLVGLAVATRTKDRDGRMRVVG
jgi:hypothetical protein